MKPSQASICHISTLGVARPAGWPLATLAIMLSLSVLSCGRARQEAVVARSHDAPRSAYRLPHGPDNTVLSFGHPAGIADMRQVSSLVQSYFHAAATDAGATACHLLLPSLAHTVAEAYGRPPGPSYMRGSTCQEVIQKMFVHLHSRFASDAATLAIAQVRVGPKGGYAVLRFGHKPLRELTIVREDGRWRVSSLLDSKLF